MIILRFMLIFGAVFALAFLLNKIIFGENIFRRIKNNISPTPESKIEEFVEKMFQDYLNNKISYSEMRTLLLSKAEERKKELERLKKMEFAKLRREKLKKINEINLS